MINILHSVGYGLVSFMAVLFVLAATFSEIGLKPEHPNTTLAITVSSLVALSVFFITL